ncbi:MAG: family 16 glycoside hydrolase, partial [Planctomycetota bacterium]
YLSGVISDRTERSITIRNDTESAVVSLEDIAKKANGEPHITSSPLSLMPVGQLAPMSNEEIRDMLAYLASPTQVPMLATADNLSSFFDGQSLQGWIADPAYWSVENGELVGKTDGLGHNIWAKSELLLADFRLTLEVKLVDNQGNSGIQFRSEAMGPIEVKGYQADIGQEWWGKLYEEHGRGLLWEKPGDEHIRPGDWNTYEILAVGDHLRTAINGKLCVDLKDPEGARAGIIALQLHSGGATEVRFRSFALELEPEPRLKTLR